ncbi:MAG: lipoyl(octanoyl) transferase LipB [Clostridiaceae bacterium]|nr:lipoyl(octanoyl) transferase LipB [Clostridiaceae bacterium]
MKKILLLELGRTHYKNAYEIQKELVTYLQNNEDATGFFVLTEHYPVFTIGKSGGHQDFLYPIEKIKEMGIEIYESDRGGKITYHGLGQIVGYPILNLKNFKSDVRWYVDHIENIIIQSLKEISVKSGRKDKYTGVWIEDEKVCAIGIRFKRWITMHGFAVNFNTNMEDFKLINPCGITDYGVTSVNKINPESNFDDFIKAIKNNFQKALSVELIETTIEEVRKTYDRSKTKMD